jgi:single-stranded DNA-binding protein
MKFHSVVRLCKDPVIFNSGCSLNVAEKNMYARDDDKKTDFFQVKAFNKTADIICQYCHTGDQIFIEGHCVNNNYEKDGVKIFQNDFIIDNVMLLSKPKEEPEHKYVIEKKKEVEIEEDLPF